MHLIDKLQHLSQFLCQKLLNRCSGIRVGDTVDFGGIKCRVMAIDKNNMTTVLSKLLYWEKVPTRYLKLIKSVQLPNLEPGDMVLIKPITDGEIGTYALPWSNPMHEIVKEGKPVEVLRIENNFCNHPMVVVDWKGGYVCFMTYHVEKVDDYDLI